MSRKSTVSFFTYAIKKRLHPVGADALKKQLGHTSITFVLPTLCGPYYHEDGCQVHFTLDSVKKIIQTEMKEKPTTLCGDKNKKIPT
jgi:hypothetical protein